MLVGGLEPMFFFPGIFGFDMFRLIDSSHVTRKDLEFKEDGSGKAPVAPLAPKEMMG